MDKIIKITCKGSGALPTKKLKRFQGNLKTLEQSEFEKLERSIIKYGFSFPVFVWKNHILDGHQRLFVVEDMLKRGWTLDGDIPVVEIEAKDRVEAGEKLLLLNSHYAKMTDDGLYEFLHENQIDIGALAKNLTLPDIDMDKFLEGWVEDQESDRDEDVVPEPPEDPVSKTGDLYILGDHRLLCGDATKKENVERLMDGEKAGMVFTDPPYGVNYNGGASNKKKRMKMIGDDTVDLFKPCCEMAFKFTQADAPLYLWHAGTKGNAAAAAAVAAGYEIRCEIIWYKLKAHFGAFTAQYMQKHEPLYYCFKRNQGARWCGPSNEVTVWEFEQASKNDYHPTQKPVGLAERAIKNHSVKLILDLFGGSGSTLIACEKIGRRCYMMEIDPVYIDVIVRRWEEYAGKKAVLTNGS